MHCEWKLNFIEVVENVQTVLIKQLERDLEELVVPLRIYVNHGHLVRTNMLQLCRLLYMVYKNMLLQ
jgi:hypothetical protein